MTALAAMPAARAADDGLSLSDAWIRMIVPMRPAAGYFTLKNDGDAARVLTGASSPACGSIMLHQSKSSEGAETMAMVKHVTVPAHGSISFAPRGYHLMCMKPSAEQMKRGQQVPVTLSFEDGATLTGPFEVRGAGGK
ncbi:MAG TPA: copper chaperone PCu(A)C [Alphaproteobacteria bacterium]|nr:copper chaperone PCu(A)C [Alphaproteobacteria bacterium]